MSKSTGFMVMFAVAALVVGGLLTGAPASTRTLTPGEMQTLAGGDIVAGKQCGDIPFCLNGAATCLGFPEEKCPAQMTYVPQTGNKRGCNVDNAKFNCTQLGEHICMVHYTCVWDSGECSNSVYGEEKAPSSCNP